MFQPLRIAPTALLMCIGLWACSTFGADEAITAAIASERPPVDRAQDHRRKPDAVLRFLEVGPGQQVLDYYAGPGYWSELIARAVGPSGAVLIYNDPLYTQAAHHELMLRLARKRLPNARMIGGPSNYLKLAPESLDRVLFVQVYHDIYWQPRDAAEPLGDPQKVLGILHAALKPGGLVVVIDHVANNTPRSSVTSMANRTHRIDPQIVREDFARAGFEFISEDDAFRSSTDDHTRSVFDPSVRHRTDQFMYKFRKGTSD